MTNETGSVKIVHLSSIKVDQFMKALSKLSRDEYRPHLANIVYDDYHQNAEANLHAKQSLPTCRAQRAG